MPSYEVMPHLEVEAPGPEEAEALVRARLSGIEGIRTRGISVTECWHGPAARTLTEIEEIQERFGGGGH